MAHLTVCRGGGIGAQAERVLRQEELGGKKAKKQTNKRKDRRDTDT